MAKFDLRRPNASWKDLPNDGLVEGYNRAKELVSALGLHRIREAYLVQAVTDFGTDRLISALNRMGGLGYHSPDSLLGIITEEIASERKAQPRQNERPFEKRLPTGTSPLSDLLSRTLPVPPAPEKTSRLAPNHYTRQTAIDWMASHHPTDLDLWENFFSFVGIQPGYGEIYILKG